MEKYALFQLYFVILQSSYTTKQKPDEKTIISHDGGDGNSAALAKRLVCIVYGDR